MAEPDSNTDNKQDLEALITDSYEDSTMIPKLSPQTTLLHLPLKKFKPPSWQKPACVIVACGSYSPPTYLHLRIMEEAKDALQDAGFEVIGGILSPVHDNYGELHKSSLKKANGLHRVTMAKLATLSSTWIGVSDFEIAMDKWTRTAVVLDCYGKALNAHYQTFNTAQQTLQNGRQIRLKFLGGSDLLHSMKTPGLWSQAHMEIVLGHHGMIVCERESHILNDAFYEQHELLTKHRDNIHAFKPCVHNTISSTKVRELIALNKSIKYLTPDPVIDYIKQQNLYTPEEIDKK
eukprot:CAMPEP_0202691796 /NCGR_PEP_ID=MMETSP1385-20130828/6408_1 /ASSEMBLY_ACC=CAM_ASM_000861 /TAXON_ID=933848 /ORGANISM="Elphidium margaritaceum" /LENGTH=290 /DNA_ID=CAMNT_0049347249 /DNA_START=27 /DNA_END=899 /DNA_ORIENTATION=+